MPNETPPSDTPRSDATPGIAQPPRPSAAEVEVELAAHIKALAGPDAIARPEQLAAVTAVAVEGRRTLLVARTGFGKSGVYFSLTRILRDRGWGPTIVISPLLALMRDQVTAAQRLGLNAVTINSSNVDAWDAIEAQIHGGQVDLILIAPERLANEGFRRRVFNALRRQAFALVCDEAHCISDWGHDFRPDYRRLRQLLADLPAWTPVLATTATANRRVADDVAGQLGADTLTLRTSLDRESLRLSVVELPAEAERFAWMDAALTQLDGSGIIYCLTVESSNKAAEWLRSRGHAVAAYSGAVSPDDRLTLEDDLRENRLKALVATSALGMGFDKGDMAFCIHLGLPPSPVAYYQQIGRAGRAISTAHVVALPRPAEDAAIWRWFESVSLPSEEICTSLLNLLDDAAPMSIAAIEPSVNMGRSRLSTLLNILEVDGAIERLGGGWVRTDRDWQYNRELASLLHRLRREESDQMLHWASLTGCRLRYLREQLDDAEADDCGRCDRCTGEGWDIDLPPSLVAEALRFLNGGGDGPAGYAIEPRRMWPAGVFTETGRKGKIAPDRQCREGRSLAVTGDGGWSAPVLALIDACDRAAADLPGTTHPSDPPAHKEPAAPNTNTVADGPTIPDAMLKAVVAVLKDWPWERRPTWICPMPSRRRSSLIQSLAQQVGAIGKLPVHPALKLAPDGPPADEYQADQANSAHQVLNAWGRFQVDSDRLPTGEVLTGPCLLIDDEALSRWTLTTAGHQLREAGATDVLPLTLHLR